MAAGLRALSFEALAERPRGVSGTLRQVVGEPLENVDIGPLRVERARGLGFLERFAAVAALQVDAGQRDVGVGGLLRRLEQHGAIGPDGLVPSRQRARQLVDARGDRRAVAAGRVRNGFDQLADGADELSLVAVEL